MTKLVYWCAHCEIPIIENTTCPICGNNCAQISVNGVCNPVFMQEKKLLSYIFDKDLSNSNIWYLGSSYYLVDGKRIRLPYMDFYKQGIHEQIAERLRESITVGDAIPCADLFIEANKSYMVELIYEAEKYVSSLVGELEAGFMPTVSFSGGKDSSVVSRIVRDALQQESIIHHFGNTTIEFPSTYKYVLETFRAENPFTPMLPSETNNDFFRLCNVFGPPSKFERWCCTIFKTSGLNTEYQNLVGNSLTFLGIRRSESRERQNYDRTQDHSKIGSQINAMPIIDWSDCDVWLYILYKGILFNDAYRWGYKRVGCWCCPNNSEWSTMLTDIYYPELAVKWRNTLYDFAQKTGKDNIEDYVENGRWKARKGASGLETRNVAIADTPCNLSDKARNIIIKKKLGRDVIDFLKPFGRLSIFDREDATYITIIEQEVKDDQGLIIHKKRKLCDLVITWNTTVIKVLPTKGTDIKLLVNRLKCQMRKYQYCIRCSACDSLCPYGAINTMGIGRYVIEETRCKQNTAACSRCIAKFYNGCITCQVLAGKKNSENDESNL